MKNIIINEMDMFFQEGTRSEFPTAPASEAESTISRAETTPTQAWIPTT